jgi:hypothetical protein
MNHRTRGVQAVETIGAPGRDAKTIFGNSFCVFARTRTPVSYRTVHGWGAEPGRREFSRRFLPTRHLPDAVALLAPAARVISGGSLRFMISILGVGGLPTGRPVRLDSGRPYHYVSVKSKDTFSMQKRIGKENLFICCHPLMSDTYSGTVKPAFYNSRD